MPYTHWILRYTSATLHTNAEPERVVDFDADAAFGETVRRQFDRTVKAICPTARLRADRSITGYYWADPATGDAFVLR